MAVPSELSFCSISFSLSFSLLHHITLRTDGIRSFNGEPVRSWKYRSSSSKSDCDNGAAVRLQTLNSRRGRAVVYNGKGTANESE